MSDTNISQTSMVLVRIYCIEGEGRMRKLLSLLHDEEKVLGVTVFRGIAGFGASGRIHSSGLIDLALELPLVIEFFDEREKVERIVADLSGKVKPGHIISWPITVHG